MSIKLAGFILLASLSGFVNAFWEQLLWTGLSSTNYKIQSSAQDSSDATLRAHKYIFSFGDSYTTTGFDAAGSAPNAANPIGNPTYPGKTLCSEFCGPTATNWIDVVTAKYNTSLVYTYNYADGGATIDANLVKPYNSNVNSMADQMSTFLSTANTTAPWSSTNTLFSFFIGINDIGNTWWHTMDHSAFSDKLLNAYFSLVQEAHNAGARKFLFVNVPPVERSPKNSSGLLGDIQKEKDIIDTYNTKLAAKVAAFQYSHPGTKTWVYDAHAKLGSILDNPRAYGFRDNHTYGSARDLVWCNYYHISPGVHEYYGRDIATLITGGFF